MAESTSTYQTLAPTKVYARIHDPAEKALVLLRDPAGHEGGTSRSLKDALFAGDVPQGAADAVRRADHWASAADRPQFPKRDSDGRFAKWTQIDFSQRPVLKHPLSARAFDLSQRGDLRTASIQQAKAQSEAHFRSLIRAGDDGDTDWWQTLLAFWRFGPELATDDDDAGLGELWRRLPADTRVPDHTIWDHLDLVSAFSGAFAADSEGRCALLNVSLGPVQEFIAAARTTSDLWAGSHLLSRLSWEAMKVIAEAVGPDAFLFPNLRGVPQVDLWLRDQGLPLAWFQSMDWYQRRRSDANPLFSAAVPNRFLAVVPEDKAERLAQTVTERVREWAQSKGRETINRLLSVAEIDPGDAQHAFEQAEVQLAGFPEVHWSVIGYSELVDGGQEPNTEPLRKAMAPFYEDTEAPGFLGSEAWRVLQNELSVTDPEDGEAAVFYRPNPGVLYPAIYELGERSIAASKAVRPFQALDQHGYRCSLTGEAEWLSDWRNERGEPLTWPPGRRAEKGTLWTRVAQQRPAWARKGEHLGALSALKRVWPTLFCEEVQDTLDLADKPSRFVVSTHTMALVPTLRRIINGEASLDALNDDDKRQAYDCQRSALPRQLVAGSEGAFKRLADEDADLLARLPSWLEAPDEADDDERQRRRQALGKAVGVEPEAYYALVLLDGDEMGAWLGGDPKLSPQYRAAFHPDLADRLQAYFPNNAGLQTYLDAPRAVSPARHLAISAALNDFSTTIARHVVEDRYAGRLLYAGGDDLMAMLPTSDLLPAMRELRQAYRGEGTEPDDGGDLGLGGGFARHRGRLHLAMGDKATASAGAVIAHHQTPLASVLEELRHAEQRAKNEGGRDAFSLSVLKRAGGALRYTANWDAKGQARADAITTINEFADALRDPEASRRAAYNVTDWLAALPEPDAVGGREGLQVYLAAMLHAPFYRQGIKPESHPSHAPRFADLAASGSAAETRERLASLLGIAEFLGRESRR